MAVDGLVVHMVPVLAEGVAGLPTAAVIVLGGLWALAEFADIHLLFF